MAKVGIQLYTVRDALSADFEGVIRRIAAMGYDGVEPAGNYGTGVHDAKALFDSLNLEVPSAHMGALIADAEARSKALDDALVLGAQYVVVPFIPPDQFESPEQIVGHCHRINEAAKDAAARGLKLVYHNHAWEFTSKEALGYQTPFDLMLKHLDPSVGFELDTYWAQHAGVNPEVVVADYNDRIPLIHVKDGHPGTDQAMLAAGDGSMDFPSILNKAKANWWIVELDRHDGDMMDAVARSMEYMKTLVPGKAI